MISSPTRRWDRETMLVAAFAACASMAAFLIYYQRGTILLYGDAVAHINIARRVFDSRTPGLLQLGTVWLPLPHLLILPFIIPITAWQSGSGASIPSLVAYVLGVAGIFRLVRGALSFPAEPDLGASLAAWLAAAIYGANPNLLYLQTTAMTEPLYLALFVWALVYFNEYLQLLRTSDSDLERTASHTLFKCGLCMAAAELTRYDGWFAGAVFVAGALLAALRHGRGLRMPGIKRFIILVAAVPVFWVAYNWIIYRNPLEFANGPYSARAIEEKTATPGFPPHPGTHDLVTAGQYFLKSAEANVAEGNWQKLWIALAVVGVVLTFAIERQLWALLLVWIPLPFYMLSISYGDVPLFVPTWWPFSYYNVRYGIELLPALAVFVALAAYYLVSLARPLPGKIAVAVATLVVVVLSYHGVWRAQPVSFREAWVNSRTRLALEGALAKNLSLLPPDSTLLMYLGDHVGALQRAGIPLRRVINEGNHRTWKRPTDPEGLWERALATPSQFADFAIGIDDDPVAQSASQHNLQGIAVIQTPGQPQATIYFTKEVPAPPPPDRDEKGSRRAPTRKDTVGADSPHNRASRGRDVHRALLQRSPSAGRRHPRGRHRPGT
jgi:hypothetical protein